MGLPERAWNSYKKALVQNHTFPAAYHGMAKVEMMRANIDQAKGYIEKVLSVDPYNFQALSDMANLMLLRGERADKALPFAKRAVLLNPPFYRPYLIMGTILIISGEDKNAEGFYKKAIELHAPDYQLLFNKEWAYSFKSDRERQRYYLKELLKQGDVPDHIRKTAKNLLVRLNSKR